MFILKRNQVIITALVIMIAVAGYLNYVSVKDGKAEETTALNELTVDSVDKDGIITALVPNDDVVAEFPEGDIIALEYDELEEVFENTTEATESETQLDNGAAVFVNASSDSTYFVQAKLSREQSRAMQRELLTQMINNANVEQEKRAESAEAMLAIQKRIEMETAAEAMIEAKGFTEAYVRIDDSTVDVVVSKETLSEAEVAQIEDIVKRKTGYGVENIRISPLLKG